MSIELSVEDVFIFFWVFSRPAKEILETTLILVLVVTSQGNLRLEKEILRKAKVSRRLGWSPTGLLVAF